MRQATLGRSICRGPGMDAGSSDPLRIAIHNARSSANCCPRTFGCSPPKLLRTTPYSPSTSVDHMSSNPIPPKASAVSSALIRPTMANMLTSMPPRMVSNGATVR